jgi:hypothetical protein
MELIRKLYEYSYEKALETRVACLCVGLGYTAVLTDDGGLGIAYTYFKDKYCCSLIGDYWDYEGERAVELLAEIKNPAPLNRSMGLALVNALNHQVACVLPEDSTNRFLLDYLGIGPKTRVAMVGNFQPLVKLFRERGALVEVLDEMQGIGDETGFSGRLGEWAETLLVTSTSILNDTTEKVLGWAAPGVKVAMLGPSTPMIAEAFSHLPVHILAGSVPLDREGVLKAVRHGAGTPIIQRFSRKVYLTLS